MDWNQVDLDSVDPVWLRDIGETMMKHCMSLFCVELRVFFWQFAIRFQEKKSLGTSLHSKQEEIELHSP